MSNTATTAVVYRLRYRSDNPDTAPLYFRRTGRDRRHGWLLYCVVDDECRQPPTEWRTLQGVTNFIKAHPWIDESFDIVEVK